MRNASTITESLQRARRFASVLSDMNRATRGHAFWIECSEWLEKERALWNRVLNQPMQQQMQRNLIRIAKVAGIV